MSFHSCSWFGPMSGRRIHTRLSVPKRSKRTKPTKRANEWVFGMLCIPSCLFICLCVSVPLCLCVCVRLCAVHADDTHTPYTRTPLRHKMGGVVLTKIAFMAAVMCKRDGFIVSLHLSFIAARMGHKI